MRTGYNFFSDCAAFSTITGSKFSRITFIKLSVLIMQSISVSGSTTGAEDAAAVTDDDAAKPAGDVGAEDFDKGRAGEEAVTPDMATVGDDDEEAGDEEEAE
jgi:hypothetical protein